MVAAATRVVLPAFAARNKPFVLVFWSRDPDGTQHNQGDSLRVLVPGINGPTSLRRDPQCRRRPRPYPRRARRTRPRPDHRHHRHSGSRLLDHSKQSATSRAAGPLCGRAAGTAAARLPGARCRQGARLPLIDPDNGILPSPKEPSAVRQRPHRRRKDHPKVIVAANGGRDLVYVPDGTRHRRELVAALLAQDYVSGFCRQPVRRVPRHAHPRPRSRSKVPR